MIPSFFFLLYNCRHLGGVVVEHLINGHEAHDPLRTNFLFQWLSIRDYVRDPS